MAFEPYREFERNPKTKRLIVFKGQKPLNPNLRNRLITEEVIRTQTSGWECKHSQGIFGILVDSLALHLGSRCNRKRKIHEAQEAVISAYRSFFWKPGIDYSKAAFRDAYCLIHFVAHVVGTRDLFFVLDSSHHACAASPDDKEKYLAWLNAGIGKKKFNVCSIGGGPGSDILGFMLALKKLEVEGIEINCVIYDLYEEWHHSLKALASKNAEFFAAGNTCNVRYVKYDFAQGIDRDMHENLLAADLVTFVKSVSSFNEMRVQNMEVQINFGIDFGKVLKGMDALNYMTALHPKWIGKDNTITLPFTTKQYSKEKFIYFKA